MATEKMNAIFYICTLHIKVCWPFRDQIRPFFAKDKSTSLVDFDVKTKYIDKEAANSGTSKYIALDKEHDEFVDIFAGLENDNRHGDPDDPAYPKV